LSTTDRGATGRDNSFGHGRVNAAAAVQAAINAKSTADSTAPLVSVTSPTGGSSVAGVVAVSVGATDNVAVTRVDLRVNGVVVASDTSAPFSGFSWASAGTANGAASLVAVAYDAAGNSASSTAVSVMVANGGGAADTTAPMVAIQNPLAGSVISGSSVTISAKASDNAGATGLTQSLYIDGALKASATGGSLSYRWNLRKLASGPHTIQVVARDAAGNTATASVAVTR
jgi:thermitase